jgi:hypothetical protein
MGHFLIKSADNAVGYVIVNSGSTHGLFYMGNMLQFPTHPHLIKVVTFILLIL